MNPIRSLSQAVFSQPVRLVCVLIIITSCTTHEDSSSLENQFIAFVQMLESNQLEGAQTALHDMLQSVTEQEPSSLVIDQSNLTIVLNLFNYLKAYGFDKLHTFSYLQTNSLTELLHIWGVAPFYATDASRIPVFTNYDVQYIRDILALKKISSSICSKTKTPIENSAALNQWIFTHVVHVREGLGSGYHNALIAPPFEVLERGFGLCDLKAWIFCALAQQQGFHAAVVYLMNPDNGQSDHTIASVMLPDQIILADPTYAAVLFNKAENRYLQIADIKNRPDRVSSVHPAYAGDLKFQFSSAIFFLAAYPAALQPKMQIIQRLFDKFYADPPCLYINIEKEFAHYAHHFSPMESRPPQTDFIPLLKLSGGTNLLTLWEKPLRIINFMNTTYAANLDILVPEFFEYRHARTMHLMGHFDEALKEYQRIRAGSDNKNIADDVAYFTGLLYFDRGDYSMAIDMLTQYLNNGYSNWKTHAVFLLSQAYRKQGDTAKAKECIEKIKTNPLYAAFTEF